MFLRHTSTRGDLQLFGGDGPGGSLAEGLEPLAQAQVAAVQFGSRAGLDEFRERELSRLVRGGGGERRGEVDGLSHFDLLIREHCRALWLGIAASVR
jgi:hypothetical protein